MDRLVIYRSVANGLFMRDPKQITAAAARAKPGFQRKTVNYSTWAPEFQFYLFPETMEKPRQIKRLGCPFEVGTRPG